MASNSELLEKKRELLEKKKALLEIQRSIMHEESLGPKRSEALKTGVAQGLTLGFSDEMAALGAGGRSARETEPQSLATPGQVRAPRGIGGPSFSPEGREAYQLGRETSMTDSEFRRNELREKYPGTMLTGEMAGGAASGIGLFGLMNKTAMKGLPIIPRVVGAGAAEGAAFGAGMSRPGERGQGALIGAGIGGFATPLGLGLTTTATSILRPIAKRLGESLLGTPRDRAIKEVMKALDAEDITKDEASVLINQMGRNATIADLGDAPARLGRAVTSEAGPAASQAKRFLDFRQMQSQNELRSAARRATGASNFDKGVIEVINNAESAAAPIYNEVFSEVLDVTPAMMDLLDRPALRAARGRAAQILKNEGFSADIVDDITDVRYMDAIKRALDDKISAAARRGEGNQVRVLTQLKRDFVSEIDAQVPTYAEARSIFAGEAAMRDAAEVGRTIFKGSRTSVSDATELLGGMSESELQAARYGFLEWLSDELAGQSTRRNTVVNKFNDVPKFRRMTQLLFPSQQQVDDFLQAASTQSRFAQTKNLITGGSPTARIQADREALSPGFMQVATEAATGQFNGISSALRLIKGNTKLSPEVIEEIGKILFDPSIIPEQLSRGPVRLFDVPRMPPLIAAGGMGGAVGSQQDQMIEGLRAVGLIGR